MNVSEYADITPTQYEEARNWISRNWGESTESFPFSALETFSRIIETARPSWLRDAESLVRTESELPEDALQVADVIAIPDQVATGEIQRLGRKVDLEARERVGNSGERAILDLLEVRSPFRVDHVAAWSDSHGYDISIEGPHECFYLEVKASTRKNRKILYLSRNEYEVMRWLPGWKLLFVHLNEAYQFLNVFEVDPRWIERTCPRDTSAYGRWEGVRLELPDDAVTEGVLGLEKVLVDRNSPLLS